jgi:hypothetical protein
LAKFLVFNVHPDPDQDPHSLEKLDTDLHSPKKLDPDPHKVNADPKHWSVHKGGIL